MTLVGKVLRRVLQEEERKKAQQAQRALKSLQLGEKGMYKRTAKVGEEWTFVLEENEAEPFLSKFGFAVKDCCDAHELEERYFRNSKGAVVAEINGTHEIVTATKN